MHVSEWDTCCSLQDVQDSDSPQTPAKKHPTLAESFYRCVPYDKKWSRWKAFTDTVTLNIVFICQYMCHYIRWSQRFIHILKMFDPRFVLRSHNGSSAEEVDRLVFLVKNMLKRQPAHTSWPVHLPTCDDMYADVWYSHLVTSHLYNCTTSCVLLSATVRVIVLSIRSHQTDYI